ncbi:MAG: hypothetical protein H7Y02_13915 [Candidatus Obscuribacterales bacterium]|nr:hypothetical protein [Steroidobacteraceae bacterium]
MSIRTLALAVSLALGVSSVVAVVAPQSAYAAEKDQQKVSNKVGVALKAAQEAITKKQFDVANAKIKEAEAVEKKTPFDQFQINEFWAFYYANQNKHSELVPLYEKSLEMNQFLAPEQASLRVKVLSQLTFRAQQYAKSIDYAKRYLKDHPNDVELYGVMADSYYRQGDCKQSREAAYTAMSVADKAGNPPQEPWLLFARTCSGKLDDAAGYVSALEKLVRHYPKPEYWESLLDRASRNERNDRVMFGIFRLQSEVGALKKAEHYMEYAQIAVDQAMPGEALKVVETGFKKEVLGVEQKDKERHQRLLNGIKEKATADRAQLPQYEKEALASTAPTGQLDAGLGLAYFSYDMYDQAIQSLEKGLKKGGLKNSDEYRIVLGIAQLRKGQRDLARTQFKSVPADSPMAKIANLWTLRTYNN